ncbi:hypothetical protein QJS66_11885 [Kocuria rhizophila]|nr:hypothetical protein QJS66_11885 [Kocuria rhizophila]
MFVSGGGAGSAAAWTASRSVARTSRPFSSCRTRPRDHRLGHQAQAVRDPPRVAASRGCHRSRPNGARTLNTTVSPRRPPRCGTESSPLSPPKSPRSTIATVVQARITYSIRASRRRCPSSILSIRDGELLVLVGPSGSGKSSQAVRSRRPRAVTRARVHRRPRRRGRRAHDRDVAMVLQSYALYPNMTARQNMSFALENRSWTALRSSSRVSAPPPCWSWAPHGQASRGHVRGRRRRVWAMGR